MHLRSQLRTHLAFAIACFATLAQAGALQVTVTDRDGKPAADVVVLVNATNAAAARPAAAPVVIAKESLRFAPFMTVVPVGSTLRFVNRDNYDHHVRSTPSGPLGSMPAAQYFELRLDAAQDAPAQRGYGDDYATPAASKKSGTSVADVKVTQPGPIGLGCHLHSSMRGQVYVSATPWFGKTDANGVLKLDGLPDGHADITIWHPDQLQEQAALKAQIGSQPAEASGSLNFTPRRRRA